jgi:hypothetical protein
VPPLSDLGPALVEPGPLPLPHLREIRADMIQGNVAGPRRGGVRVRGPGQHDQHVPGLHRGAGRRRHLVHQAGGLRPHLVLHLHRLDDDQLVPGRDQVSRPWP